MFVALPSRPGEVQRLDGFFTRAFYLRQQPAAEIERRLGYRAGRLAKGWWLLFLMAKPTVHQFEYRGYTTMSGGVPQGHLPGNAGRPHAEQTLRAQGINLTGTEYQAAGLKQKTVDDAFQMAGPMRLAKVRPVAPAAGQADLPDYPPGTGFPQWTLTVPLPWVAAAFLAPGEQYEGNYV